ncbi:MAG: dihydroorotate dehydrogenase electron transfer subunit [Candidatus Cloacimonas sp.]
MSKPIPLYIKREIYSSTELTGNYFVLRILDEELALKCKPGQFFELRAAKMETDCSLPKLFKPISIYDVTKVIISFLIKKRGSGTNSLSKSTTTDLLEMIGPLGNGFPIVSGRNVLLVSGGIGYPPLSYLYKELIAQNQIYWIHGGGGSNDVFPCNEVWTIDGSYGNKGMVTENLENILTEKKIDLIYSCGPIPMLKECFRKASKLNIEQYCSLEAYMACGIGSCYGCAVPIGKNDQWNYLRVCQEGPVFNAEEVLWNLL